MTPSSASAERRHDARAPPARRSRRWPSRCASARAQHVVGQRGATSTRSVKPITFIARAAAPTLPAWLVPTRMKRVGSAAGMRGRLKSVPIILQRAPLRRPGRPPRRHRSRRKSSSMSQALHPMLNIAIKAARARRGDHQPRLARPRPAARSTPRRRTTSSPRSTTPPRRRSSTRCSAPIPATASSPKNPAARTARRTASTSGSSTRSTAPPTSSTACRSTRSRSRLAFRGQVQQAVVYDPTRNDLFFASQGPRRLPQRQAPARLQAHAHGRRADRHRLSVPQGRQPRALPADVRDGDAELRRRCAARAPRRSTSATSPPAGTTASSRPACRPGTSPPAR